MSFISACCHLQLLTPNGTSLAIKYHQITFIDRKNDFEKNGVKRNCYPINWIDSETSPFELLSRWYERSFALFGSEMNFVFPEMHLSNQSLSVRFKLHIGISNEVFTSGLNLLLHQSNIIDSTEKITSHIMRKSGAIFHCIYSKRRMSPSLLRSFAGWHDSEGPNDLLVSYIIVRNRSLDKNAEDALNPFKTSKHIILEDPSMQDLVISRMDEIKRCLLDMYNPENFQLNSSLFVDPTSASYVNTIQRIPYRSQSQSIGRTSAFSKPSFRQTRTCPCIVDKLLEYIAGIPQWESLSYEIKRQLQCVYKIKQLVDGIGIQPFKVKYSGIQYGDICKDAILYCREKS